MNDVINDVKDVKLYCYTCIMFTFISMTDLILCVLH